MKTSSVIGPARLVCVRALVLAALAAALAFPSAAAADDLAPPTDALQALQNENVVAASASVPASSDSDSALVASGDGASVDVPVAPEDGITLDPPAADPFTIGIPGASEATEAQKVADGLVVYGGTADDTDSAAQILPAGDADRGGVRLLTILYGADSPSDFAFPISLGSGETLMADGDGFRIAGQDGATIARIDPPWARDANGNDVPATYALDDGTIVMHVEHGADSAYPIVADPKSIVEDDEAAVIQTIRPGAPSGPPPDPVAAPAPAPSGSGGSTGGTRPAPRPPAAPTLDVNDPLSIMSFISALQSAPDGGAALWATLTSAQQQALQAFVTGGSGEDGGDGGMVTSYAAPAALGRCKAATHGVVYRNYFHVTLWTFGIGFRFCYDGTKITYVSDVVSRGTAHWGWDYRGAENQSVLGGGVGSSYYAVIGQGHFSCCAMKWVGLKQMNPWVRLVARADGSVGWAFHE